MTTSTGSAVSLIGSLSEVGKSIGYLDKNFNFLHGSPWKIIISRISQKYGW